MEEVQSHKIQLEENVAYGPVEQSHMIELKENVAYGPVKWCCSLLDFYCVREIADAMIASYVIMLQYKS